MKYEDLKCEFCDGKGDKEKFVEPYGDSPVTCTYCNGTGIDESQLKKLIQESYVCLHCGYSADNHSQDQLCPVLYNGVLHEWRETKYAPSTN